MSSPQSGVYCTIVAQNYLPQALSLYESVRKQEPERRLVLLVVDADRTDLMAGRENLTVVTTASLGLSERDFHSLAAIYDVVELSTAVKPLLLRELLATYEQAVYIDPDMYLVEPLLDLEPLLREHPAVLTPHFLHPIPPGSSYVSEVHSLTVGVHNLGFCAVSRAGLPFLDWWWSHLERECLIYPLLGLFVDQKWTDVGANLFRAYSLFHAGYNVGPWNLLEREIVARDGGYVVGEEEHPLRLLHFSGFNPNDPEAISERMTADLRGKVTDSVAYRDLSREYAQLQLTVKRDLGQLPSYAYDVDSLGKRISKRLRRAYRADLLDLPAGKSMPSPFLPADKDRYAAWRRAAGKRKFRLALGDIALAAKYAMPDTFNAFKRRLPGAFRRSREQLLAAGKVRR